MKRDEPSQNPYSPPQSQDLPPPRDTGPQANLFVKHGAVLPEVCLKCGATDEVQHMPRTFATQPPRKNALVLAMLFGALGAAIAGAAAARDTKRASLEVPLCRRCVVQGDNARWWGFGAFGFMLLCFFFVSVSKSTLGIGARVALLFAGIAAPFVALAFMNKRRLTALVIDEEGVMLSGVDRTAKERILQLTAASENADRPRKRLGGARSAGGEPSPPKKKKKQQKKEHASDE
ncbi:MAG: hypothetical protein U0271_17190 [Polyangiaceae bacterium]